MVEPVREENAMTKFTHAKVWRAIDRTAEAHGLRAVPRSFDSR